jgi:hypothetical protein
VVVDLIGDVHEAVDETIEVAEGVMIDIFGVSISKFDDTLLMLWYFLGGVEH